MFYIASSFLSLLTWWLDHNLPYTAEKMAAIYFRFFLRDRKLESNLVITEALVVIANWLNLPWWPSDSTKWCGTFAD